MTTPFQAYLPTKSMTTRHPRVKNQFGFALCRSANSSEGPEFKHALLFHPPPPDAAAESEQTSCVELIPGLQASAASSPPQESGASPLLFKTSHSAPAAFRQQIEKDIQIC